MKNLNLGIGKNISTKFIYEVGDGTEVVSEKNETVSESMERIEGLFNQVDMIRTLSDREASKTNIPVEKGEGNVIHTHGDKPSEHFRSSPFYIQPGSMDDMAIEDKTPKWDHLNDWQKDLDGVNGDYYKEETIIKLNPNMEVVFVKETGKKVYPSNPDFDKYYNGYAGLASLVVIVREKDDNGWTRIQRLEFEGQEVTVSETKRAANSGKMEQVFRETYSADDSKESKIKAIAKADMINGVDFENNFNGYIARVEADIPFAGEVALAKFETKPQPDKSSIATEFEGETE